ncbi:MAG: 50S ribosomal protein L23 [Gammaproteobacteria bacterium]|nr:50S ribosomal protein L23 [Gammaproteobacteria bacterium]MCS5543262.1 50S ribosomal protein L23 [SAR86 cluster bacterium]|tara:strand:+ start:134 stop:424 length:291 start_codon:yes stop_codon:yes gene_type:complete
MKIDQHKIIKNTHFTEKVSLLMNKSNQYAFKVDKDATKRQIKRAVEKFFSVNVREVNILVNKGKTKRSRYGFRKKSDWKKAYVSLAEGQSIDMGTE